MKKLTSILIITMVVGLFNLNGFSQSWLWAKHAGSVNSAPEAGYSILNDQTGNIYVTGANSTQAIFDSIIVPCYGWTNPFLAKYNENGNILWVKHMVGSSSTQASYGKKVKIGPDGSIYIIGSFNGSFAFDTIYFNNYGGSDGFVAKFDSNGQYIWVKHIGGEGRDYLNDLTFADDGKLYILCTSNSKTFQVDTMGFSVSGPFFYSIIKMQEDGAPDTSIFFLCKDILYEVGEIEFSNYHLYFGGVFKDSIYIDGTTLISKNESFNGIFGKFNESLCSIWIKQFEGGTGTSCTSVISDDSSNVYIAGQFADTIKFSPVYSLNNDTLADLFLAKFDSTGNIKWATQLHPDISWFTSAPQIIDMSFSTNGNLHCIGNFRGHVSFGNIDMAAESGSDLFAVIYNRNGSCLGVRNVGNAYPLGIATDSEENSLISGTFDQTIDFGQYSLTSYGSSDIFIAKLANISGIGDGKVKQENNLIIFSNPTTGKCNITIPEEFLNEEELVLRIYDQMGKLVQELKVQNVGGTLKFDIQAQAKGLYHATLTNGTKIYSGKIVFE